MPTAPLSAAQAALARANAARATNQYRQTQALTVSPGQLLIMLYDGAIRFLRQGHQAIEQQDLEAAHNAICRAQDIIAELDATLDERGGAISVNLHRIYDYLMRRMLEANIAKDGELVGEVIAHLESLLGAWREAVRKVDNSGTAGNVDGVGVRVDGAS